MELRPRRARAPLQLWPRRRWRSHLAPRTPRRRLHVVVARAGKARLRPSGPPHHRHHPLPPLPAGLVPPAAAVPTLHRIVATRPPPHRRMAAAVAVVAAAAAPRGARRGPLPPLPGLPRAKVRHRKMPEAWPRPPATMVMTMTAMAAGGSVWAHLAWWCSRHQHRPRHQQQRRLAPPPRRPPPPLLRQRCRLQPLLQQRQHRRRCQAVPNQRMVSLVHPSWHRWRALPPRRRHCRGRWWHQPQ